MRDLLEVREQIDQIDATITALFQKRIAICGEIAAFKIANGRPVVDKQREQEKLASLAAKAEEPFNAHAISDLYTQIMAICRKKQYQIMREEGAGRPLPFEAVDELPRAGIRVAYQGVEGAYSHAALMEYFGEETPCFHMPTFADVLRAVKDGEADYGILPLENSSAGQVGDVYDLLAGCDCPIVAEHFLPVRHCLLGLPGAKLSDIRTVYSHPQGLMQCAAFLAKHPGWRQIGQANTATAACMVVEQGDISCAAIASQAAAKLYGLQELLSEVNDAGGNTTRFAIVSGKKIYQNGANKISIQFTLPHESGSLFGILSHMIYNNLNMTKIESRPIPEKPFEYSFFIDFEGNLAQPAVENALLGMQEEAESFKILGNY